ncbi:hypothetical protein PFISCL1PPCAC_27395 [Pristionchus fissidentatus]|uniref:Diacylglycerol kinase n=1 Tax=Pristionchus fissidentatus TaxID=1538716 RepID=A0AAV5WZC7_9BILA|nr:hypothetical protein PFISCL1PPCAC_27395 [Pristionchus fissidentatus]
MPEPLEDAIQGIAICGAVAASLYGLRLLTAPIRNKSVLNDPLVAKSGHSWVIEPFMNKGHFCSMCEQNLTGGYSCSQCRIRVDDVRCLHLASQNQVCKVNQKSTTTRKLKHHWVLGNLEPDDFCAICDEPCGEELGLNDFWCAWCCRAVHTDCKRELPETCDRGPHGRSVVPPNHITLRKGGSRNQKEMVIESLTIPPDIEDYLPLFVIVNPKSGSGAGDIVMKAFKMVLHPAQIMDVTRCNMRSCLRFMDEHPEITTRVLICGGDGTISLVMNDIEELTHRPSIAILPLGTGNDLSRILNWGTESDGRFSLKEVVCHLLTKRELIDRRLKVLNLITEIQEAQIQPLDRWTISIENTRRSIANVRTEPKSISMTNYFSLGVDARVTFGMQSTRESVPKALSSRFMNKLLFFTYGTMDLFTRTHSGLEKKIELILDGKSIDLPGIEGLVFLNIQCWGAGVKVWREIENDPQPQQLDDKKFEVFAVRSSFHIAKLQVGMSAPLRIGQASEATIRLLNESVHMQSDGEAWLQPPSTVTINHKTQSMMLRRKEPE